MWKLDIVALLISTALLFLAGYFLCQSMCIGWIGEWYESAFKSAVLIQIALVSLWLFARTF